MELLVHSTSSKAMLSGDCRSKLSDALCTSTGCASAFIQLLPGGGHTALRPS